MFAYYSFVGCKMDITGHEVNRYMALYEIAVQKVTKIQQTRKGKSPLYILQITNNTLDHRSKLFQFAVPIFRVQTIPTMLSINKGIIVPQNNTKERLCQNVLTINNCISLCKKRDVKYRKLIHRDRYNNINNLKFIEFNCFIFVFFFNYL